MRKEGTPKTLTCLIVIAPAKQSFFQEKTRQHLLEVQRALDDEKFQTFLRRVQFVKEEEEGRHEGEEELVSLEEAFPRDDHLAFADFDEERMDALAWKADQQQRARDEERRRDYEERRDEERDQKRRDEGPHAEPVVYNPLLVRDEEKVVSIGILHSLAARTNHELRKVRNVRFFDVEPDLGFTIRSKSHDRGMVAFLSKKLFIGSQTFEFWAPIDDARIIFGIADPSWAPVGDQSCVGLFAGIDFPTGDFQGEDPNGGYVGEDPKGGYIGGFIGENSIGNCLGEDDNHCLNMNIEVFDESGVIHFKRSGEHVKPPLRAGRFLSKPYRLVICTMEPDIEVCGTMA